MVAAITMERADPLGAHERFLLAGEGFDLFLEAIPAGPRFRDLVCVCERCSWCDTVRRLMPAQRYSVTFASALQAEKVRTMRTACTRMIESRPDLPKTHKLVPPECYGRSLQAEPSPQGLKAEPGVQVRQPEVSASILQLYVQE